MFCGQSITEKLKGYIGISVTKDSWQLLGLVTKNICSYTSLMTNEEKISQVVDDLPTTDDRRRMMAFEDLQALTGLEEADLVIALNKLHDRGLLFNGYIDEETGEVVTDDIGFLYKLAQ